METLTIQNIKEKGLLGYEYIRGSHLHGIATETSDIDKGGVYIAPLKQIIGLRNQYQEQVSDIKSDIVYYELGRWMELLLKGNPTAIESLFVPNECILGNVCPAIQMILDERNKFVSKEIVAPLIGYAYSQISKARGLNKKIVNPITERKTVLDFCYCINSEKGETVPLKQTLEEKKLKQEYCGLIKLNNTKDLYSVYYHLPDSNFKYNGIISSNDSNDITLSSIPKFESPILIMAFNKDAYSVHCKHYKEYKDWEKHRNPIRYKSNLNKNYDAKNMCECMRLLHMGREILEGKGVNVMRTFDREYLLDIKMHKFEYDEILADAQKEISSINKALVNSKLPDKVNIDFVNKLLINCRLSLKQ